MPARVWKSSVDKFQRYFEMFKWRIGDWAFLLDADDRLDCTDDEWEEFKTILEVVNESYPKVVVAYHLYVGLRSDPEYFWARRGVFKWFKGIHYGWNHSTFLNNDEAEVGVEEGTAVVTELRVRRTEHLRDEDRMALKQRYDEMIRNNVEWVDRPKK